MQQQHGDQVTIIGMPGLADIDDMQEFIDDLGIDGIPHIPDLDGSIWRQFDVSRQRTYVFVNDDGTMRTSGYGSLAADVENLIAS